MLTILTATRFYDPHGILRVIAAPTAPVCGRLFEAGGYMQPFGKDLDLPNGFVD